MKYCECAKELGYEDPFVLLDINPVFRITGATVSYSLLRNRAQGSLGQIYYTSKTFTNLVALFHHGLLSAKIQISKRCVS